MKATVTLKCRLANPEEMWENKQEVEFPDEKALCAFCIQRMAKILGEGGILEMHSLSAPQLHLSLKPLQRLVDMDVVADIAPDGPKIDLSTDVKAAAAVRGTVNKLDADLRNPLVFPGKGRGN